MLQGIFIKKVVDIIKKQFKLEDVFRQIKSMQKPVDKCGKSMEEAEKDIAQIKAIIKKFKLLK